MNDDWLALGCAILAIMLALIGIILPESGSFPPNYPYNNLTGIPQTFPYGNLTGIPNTYPYGNLTGVPVDYNLTDGLFLWLPLDGYVDGMIYGASWSDGSFGECLSFDGNDYVVIQNDLCQVGLGVLSVSFWVYSTVYNSNWMMMVTKSNTDEGWQFRMVITTSQLQFAIPNSSEFCISPDVLVDGASYFVVGIYDCNGGSGNIRLYVNCTLKDVGTATGLLPIGADIYLGARGDFAGANMTGLISDIRLYNHVLTADERLVLFNLP